MFIVIFLTIIADKYYPCIFSHITRQAQYEHPCATQYLGISPILMQLPLSSLQQEQQQCLTGYSSIFTGGGGSLVQGNMERRLQVPIHTQFHQPNVLVPANPYLNEGN